MASTSPVAPIAAEPPGPPRPPSEVENDPVRLRYWLLHELPDEEFARLLATTDIEGYVARAVSELLQLPHRENEPPPELRAFFDRFNARVALAESRG